MISVAYAMGSGAAPAGDGGSGGFGMIIYLLLLFVIFYFLLIRPQQKRNKAHRELIAQMKEGDKVVLNGGIHGKITGLTDTIATVEIADQVRIKVNRSSISNLVQGGTEVLSS